MFDPMFGICTPKSEEKMMEAWKSEGSVRVTYPLLQSTIDFSGQLCTYTR